MAAAGSFLTNFASSYQGAKDRKAADAARDEDRAALADWRNTQRDNAASDREYRNDELAYRRSVGGVAEPMRASDPANSNMPAHQRAFLNAISDGESGGQYNVRYSPGGGVNYDMTGDRHPRIYEEGPAGPSSAAGRYQFTWSTWRDIAGADTPFTRENQDDYAWQLAQRDYRARTGGDLDAELQRDGITDGMMESLAPTWAAFGNADRRNRYAATYNDSLSRYNQPPPEAVPAPAARGISFPGLSSGQPLAGALSMGTPFIPTPATGDTMRRSIN